MHLISLLLLLGVSASACQLGYLAHLGAGQVRTLLSRELLTPERVAALADAERAALEAVRQALAFGASLGLAETTSYRHLIDRGPAGGVHVVVAAPPGRLEPVTWWFPVTGRISYRGFFDPARAQRFAARLEQRGHDVYVRPALLYSTLGFFDDPVPREMLTWPVYDVVETALHELVHETVFVAGEPDYNEGLATFVGRHAALALLADRPDQAASARRAFADADRFAAWLDALGGELEAVYARAADDDDARRLRTPIFARYQGEDFLAQPWHTDRYLAFAGAQLSNAYLVARRTYLGALPCLQRELEALGSLEALVRAHRERPGPREDCAT